jgi:60 kDa SS-A/Ro ribonucleoprotein
MSNTKIFASASTGASRRNVATDTVNNAGGRAYSLGDKGTLVQMAVTGVFNDTFYSKGTTQLADIKELVSKVEPEFLARLALYARTKGHMKDLSAYLCAVLATRDVALLDKVFSRVIDNGKMLRNFVQMVRSGEAGRKSLGSRPKKLVAKWLREASDAQLLAASVGNSPSLSDVIRLSHPKADEASRDAFFKYILGVKGTDLALPELVSALEAFKSGQTQVLPKVPFELLTALTLTKANWKDIARNATWTQTRMNLNTFARHGVFESAELVSLVAQRLADPEQVARSKVFPYQLLAAYLNADAGVPVVVTNALQDAMEAAVANVPVFDCDVAVLVDVSGSMSDPVTGNRVGATSKVRCIDVAALFASAVLRRNPTAMVVPFDTRVHAARLNGRDSVMTNAQTLARFGGGGTNCSAALAHLNETNSTAQLVIYVSDNESWADKRAAYSRSATSVMEQWALYKARVPKAKLVCIDITPNATSQVKERRDSLNVGGFSDEVFNVVGAFAKGQLSAKHWVGVIENLEL